MKICLLFVKTSKLDMIMAYLMYNTNEDLVIVCENSKLNIIMAYFINEDLIIVCENPKLDMTLAYLMQNTNEDLIIVCEGSKLNIIMAYLMKKTCWTWGGPVMKV